MQIELHRHLDVSVRLSTLLELAQKKGLEAQSTSVSEFRKKVVLEKPLRDLKEVLATFSLFPKVLDQPEVLERIAFEVVEDCHQEGTEWVELRYSPSFLCESSKLSWDAALDSLENGIQKALKKFPKMKAGLICIAARDYGAQNVNDTVEFFLKHKSRFIGFDLAGNEAQYPCRLFESSFKKLKAAKTQITVHAGEASGPENIWEAIEILGAQRIGHGVKCVEDPKLMQYLAQHQICLEVCPTSNWLTQVVPSLAEHPLPKILRAGIPVTINTDDPSVFGTTLPQETRACREKMGMTENEIAACFDYAKNSTFLLHRA